MISFIPTIRSYEFKIDNFISILALSWYRFWTPLKVFGTKIWFMLTLALIFLSGSSNKSWLTTRKELLQCLNCLKFAWTLGTFFSFSFKSSKFTTTLYSWGYFNSSIDSLTSISVSDSSYIFCHQLLPRL